MLSCSVDFSREILASTLANLATQGIFVGTSSWKYEGWLGMIYTPSRYETRGKFSRAKFESTCLAEYAETFKSVCFDGGFYQFPSPKLLDAYLSQVTADFRLIHQGHRGHHHTPFSRPSSLRPPGRPGQP